MSEFLVIDEILSANWQSCDPMEMQRLAMRAKRYFEFCKSKECGRTWFVSGMEHFAIFHSYASDYEQDCAWIIVGDVSPFLVDKNEAATEARAIQAYLQECKKWLLNKDNEHGKSRVVIRVSDSFEVLIRTPEVEHLLARRISLIEENFT